MDIKKLSPDALYSWQRGAADTLANSDGYMLAAVPGSGKTITTLTALMNRCPKRTLLVAPRIILDSVWEQEADRWLHTERLTFDYAHKEAGALREKLWFGGHGKIVTCTPALLPKLVKAAIKRGSVAWDHVVVDESQMFKNPTASRTCALLVLSGTCSVWLLSGTPAPNGPIDLWAPGRIVTRKQDPFWSDPFHLWRSLWFRKTGPYSYRPIRGATKTIIDRFKRHALSIELDKVGSDVPQALYSTHHYEVSKDHRSRIENFMVSGRVDDCDLSVDIEQEGAFLNYLRQLTNGFVYPGGKALTFCNNRIEALLECLPPDEPALVSCFYHQDFDSLLEHIPGARIINGKTDAGERVEIIRDWNQDKIPVLLASPGSMGHGINLQLGSARTIVWYANSFNWAEFAQFNARLIRSGQRKHVSVISLCADVGLDKAMLQVLKRKGSGEKDLIQELKSQTIVAKQRTHT